jgi:hypothetical protein
MKIDAFSFAALLLAAFALFFSVSARSQHEAALAEARAANARSELQVRQLTNVRQDIALLAASLTNLGDRLEKLEKEPGREGSGQQLTVLNAQLQLTAQKADQNAREIESLRQSMQSTFTMTQDSFNAVGEEIAALKEELKTKAAAP